MKYLDRDRAVLDLSRGRRVLHLGCIGHDGLSTGDRVERARASLHWELSRVADVIGLDYSSDVVDEYTRLGLFDNVLFGNAEKLEDADVSGTFDIVLATDLIEHLSNPGRMLDGIKRFCHADTRVVLTTPHAFGLPNFMRHSLGRFREGDEHVMTFNMQTLAHLLARHGYEILELHTCHQVAARRYGILFALGRLVFRGWPKFGGTLFVIARPRRKSLSEQAVARKAAAA
jgi:SAM-dependent methyltransferase